MVHVHGCAEIWNISWSVLETWYLMSEHNKGASYKVEHEKGYSISMSKHLQTRLLREIWKCFNYIPTNISVTHKIIIDDCSHTRNTLLFAFKPHWRQYMYNPALAVFTHTCFQQQDLSHNTCHRQPNRHYNTHNSIIISSCEIKASRG